MLNEVKESIINAYEIKTGLSRAKLSHLMDSETWMNANKAVELGFADGIISRDAFPEKEDDEDEDEEKKKKSTDNSVLFSRKAVNTALKNKLVKHYSKNVSRNTGRDITDLEKRLNLLKP